MEDLTYTELTAETLTARSLDGFVRRQVVEECWRRVDGALVLRPVAYVEDWTLAGRRTRAEEMLDLAALAQSSPGAIAVNAAILVGWRVAGLAGMVTAVLGTILPPMLILSIVSLFYEAFASNYFIQLVLRGMQAGVAAVILDVTFGLGRGVLKERSVLNCLVMAGVFGASFFFGVNVVVLILASGAVGIIREVFRHRKAESAGSGDCQG